MQAIVINSDHQKKTAVDLIQAMEIDGSITIEIKNTDTSSTARQRRLRWMWAGEVANSGIGRYDTKDDVDRVGKWKFARPILERDNEFFKTIFDFFMGLVHDRDDFAQCCANFTDQYISVERMTKRQEAEYLTDFQRYWVGNGVVLTDPSTQGVDLEKLYREAA